MFRDGAARLLVFRLGPERFGLDLAAVDEVIDSPDVRPLPDAAPGVAGVATVRDALVTMYDPRPVLTVRGTVGRAALLFTRGERRVGVLVGDVQDVIGVEQQDVQSVLGRDASDVMVLGVVRRGRVLVAVLEAEAFLDIVTGGRNVATQGERT